VWGHYQCGSTQTGVRGSRLAAAVQSAPRPALSPGAPYSGGANGDGWARLHRESEGCAYMRSILCSGSCLRCANPSPSEQKREARAVRVCVDGRQRRRRQRQRRRVGGDAEGGRALEIATKELAEPRLFRARFRSDCVEDPARVLNASRGAAHAPTHEGWGRSPATMSHAPSGAYQTRAVAVRLRGGVKREAEHGPGVWRHLSRVPPSKALPPVRTPIDRTTMSSPHMSSTHSMSQIAGTSSSLPPSRPP
jgi:hypothetical protein